MYEILKRKEKAINKDEFLKSKRVSISADPLYLLTH